MLGCISARVALCEESIKVKGVDVRTTNEDKESSHFESVIRVLKEMPLYPSDLYDLTLQW